MASPFEEAENLNQEMKAEKAFKSLYRKLSKKVHDDVFNGFTQNEFKKEFDENATLKNKYEELSKERDELIKAINAIKGGSNGDGGWYKGINLNSFVEKLQAVTEAESDIASFSAKFDEFLKEANAYKAQSEKNNADANANPDQNADQTKNEPEPESSPEPESEPKPDPEQEAGSDAEENESRKDPENNSGEEGGPNKPEDDSEKAENREDILKQEMEAARKEYLETDYKTNAALNKIRKFFGTVMGKGSDKSPDIEGLKSIYEKKLLDLYEYKLENARKNEAGDKELSDLFKEFEFTKRIGLAEAYDLVKAEQVYGTNFGKIKNGLTKAVESYQKWPWQKKLAFGAACFGVGLAIAPASFLGAGVLAGTKAASLAAGFLAFRRGFGGVVGAFGAKKMMDVGDRKLQEKKIGRKAQEMEEGLKTKEGDEKYNALMAELNKMSSEDSLKNIKNWQRGKIAASIMAGLAVGGGAQYLWGVAHEGGPEISAGGKSGIISKDIHEPFDPNNVNAGGPPDKPLPTGDSPSDLAQNIIQESENPTITPVPEDASVDEPIIQESENPTTITPAPEDAPTEIDHHEPVFDQNLTIEKGSSIEGTIIKQLKEMGVENPGAKAHRMFLEYMDQNKDSIIEKVGADEYHKMLKDGMVNVQPGTELHIVADTGKDGFSLREVDGSMSHIEPKAAHIDIPDETHSDVHPVSAADESGSEIGHGSAEVLEHKNGGDIQSSASAMENGMEAGAGQENLESAVNNKEYQGRVNVTGDVSAENQGVEDAASHKMSMQDFNLKHGNVENYRGLSNFVRAEDADSVFRNKIIASENAKSLARAVFGYNISTEQFAHYLKGEKIVEIMDANGREEFLQKIPSGNGRRVFREMLKATPPKLSHENMLKWFQHVAMGAGRAKDLQTFDTTGI